MLYNLGTTYDDVSEETMLRMEDSYRLFLALLAPRSWGGVIIPKQFALPYKNALLASIDACVLVHPEIYPDYKCVTGQLNNDALRESVDFLIEQQIDALQRDPSWCLSRHPQGLQLNRCFEAKMFRAHFSLVYEQEFQRIDDRFPEYFVDVRCTNSF